MENQTEIFFKCLKFATEYLDVPISGERTELFNFTVQIYNCHRELIDPKSKTNSLTNKERIQLIADALKSVAPYSETELVHDEK